MNTTLVQCSEGIGETCQKLAERQRQSFSSEIEQIHNSFNNFHSDWQVGCNRVDYRTSNLSSAGFS